MIKFDEETINEMTLFYLNEEIEGRDPKIYADIEYFWEVLRDEFFHYQRGEISRVLKSFSFGEDSEERENLKKGVKGVKSEDVAFIASHYGFLLGLLQAENNRLNFWH